MKTRNSFDIIIVGGSYSGLAAGMALGRALRQILIIDSAKPCNRQTPYSHNFLTQDGKTPTEIATLARQQVQVYKNVKFATGLVTAGTKTEEGFHIQLATGETFTAKKLIFATGIRDIMQDIPGYAECWGISVIHCPYCHGYEVRNVKTGIIGNGVFGYGFSTLISNWTNDLTLFTNGKSTLSKEQTFKLERHNIRIEETEIEKLEHTDGYLQKIVFRNNMTASIHALYARNAFVQHCPVPGLLGCELSDDGYIKTDTAQRTTVEGIYACGDSTTIMRTLANAVSTGTIAGMTANKDLIEEEF